ncbi:M14 family metallopeptidase [Spirosoma validum]|uniref:carboxypeptidase T n=1 Tax=Spirosoma validum TaxID=2771355 RepID=A0A927B1V8_9BACT|nr:M14 family metallopeptidase [Spirosoma validum]MBD2753883.1 zinc carboxypeptidase [Spirosoma validum]
MKIKYSLAMLLSLLLWTSFCSAQRLKYHRITVQIEPLQLEHLLNNGLQVDHFSYQNKKDFVAEVSDQDIAVFKRYGIKVTYLIKDLEKSYAKINEQINRQAAQSGANARQAAVTTPTNFSLGSYGGYFTFADIPVILDRMQTLYPNLISVRTSIGNSIQGRPMYMVKISDNPDVDEEEPELMLNALHHAREPIGLSQLIFFMWHLLENYDSDPEIRTLLNSSEMYIVPCVNPDGYVYNQTTNSNGGGMWRKNRRANSGGSFGVDLNRNYGYNWGLDNSGSSPTRSSDTYRGTAAFSEPEIANMRDFMLQHQFVTALNFHAHGNYLTYPFDYQTVNTNPDLDIFKSIATYLTLENGFKTGNSQQTLNYLINGGSNDWQWGEQVAKNKIYGLLPEIGSSSDGFWPASSRIIPLCNTTIEMNKKMLRISTFYGRVTPTGSTTINQQTSRMLRYTFQNYSLKPASYTVTASSSSSYVTSIDAPKTYSGLAMLQSTPDSIGFTIDSNTPSGTPITFELAVDNGLSIQKETITFTYIAPPPVANADLTPTIYVRPTVAYSQDNITVVVNVIELQGADSNGLITVRVTKDAAVKLTFDNQATSVGNRPVQNNVWNFDGDTNPFYYILTSTEPILAGQYLSFGLEGLLAPKGTAGGLSISSVVIGGSGGETKVVNNIDADKLDYFQ